jgi:organic hydroperoxide reductase OsmC/OhrA
MGDYRATIRMVSDTADPGGGFVVEHHRTPRAAIDVDLWSGGHLLHLAIASCLFNDILREAPDRGIAVDHLAVTANGDFDQNGSSGIRYTIEIGTSADRSEVQRLVAEMEANAIIPKALRDGTPVERATVTILTE